jgi:hypothetical protein
MKTAIHQLIEELKQASEIGSNPFIITTINLVIDMAESKLKTEEQQIVNCVTYGQNNHTVSVLHDYETAYKFYRSFETYTPNKENLK